MDSVCDFILQDQKSGLQEYWLSSARLLTRLFRCQIWDDRVSGGMQN